VLAFCEHNEDSKGRGIPNLLAGPPIADGDWHHVLTLSGLP
jgi:hypothetical protein